MKDINRRKMTNPTHSSSFNTSNHNNNNKNIQNNRILKTTTPSLVMSSSKGILLMIITIFGFFINDVSNYFLLHIFIYFVNIRNTKCFKFIIIHLLGIKFRGNFEAFCRPKNIFLKAIFLSIKVLL